MIIHRYLIRETVSSFLGVTLILFVLFMSVTFVRILSDAIEGLYPVDAIFTMLLLKGGDNVVFILPLSLYLGVMLALGRLYQDSELISMTACGAGPNYVLRSVFVVALSVSMFVAGMSLFYGPWAEQLSHRFMQQSRAKVDIGVISPGRFSDLGEKQHVVYAEGRSADGALTGVFGHGSDKGKNTVLSATSAQQYVETDSGSRYLQLSQGYRYEGQPGQPNYEITQFSTYGVQLKNREVILDETGREGMPSHKLLGSRDSADQAELQWRLAIPISSLLLALLAVPLSKTTPRQGRFGRLFVGLLLFIVYSNMMTMARGSLRNGEVSPWLGIWWVHALMALAIYILYQRQQRVRRGLWR